jgi:ribosomal protein S18 acetylase RimI-like enzyme
LVDRDTLVDRRPTANGSLARNARDLIDRRLPEATLWVLEANSYARKWYERLGWKLSGKRKTTYAPAGIDDVQYRLALPS